MEVIKKNENHLNSDFINDYTKEKGIEKTCFFCGSVLKYYNKDVKTDSEYYVKTETRSYYVAVYEQIYKVYYRYKYNYILCPTCNSKIYLYSTILGNYRDDPGPDESFRGIPNSEDGWESCFIKGTDITDEQNKNFKCNAILIEREEQKKAEAARYEAERIENEKRRIAEEKIRLTSLPSPQRTSAEFEVVDGVLKKYHGFDQYVTIPQWITSIGNSAFSRFAELIHVVIPQGVTQIGEDAFGNCKNLKGIKIPQGMITIERDAFLCCTNLASIIIPQTVTNVGYRAFSNFKNTQTIFIEGGKKQARGWRDGWRDYCNAKIVYKVKK